ncbi:MAG: DUF547 domain-containing protein [Acidobacteria bacterium]|nr:DUF547 domain-containing protein [Acidobacteriota bacterium]
MKATKTLIVATTVILIGVGWWWADGPERAESEHVQFAAPSGSAQANEFSLDAYAAALRRYVNERGLVNYRGLKANSSELDTFSVLLAGVSPAELDSWSEQQKIAFWINAYNALTLEAIIRNYPIQSSLLRSVVYPKNSIRQIPGVWDKLRFAVAGREMTLDEIEHATLRAQFSEPRIHVALVCAAMSCPPLRNEPYTPEQLDAQLGVQARRFLRSARGLRIDRGAGKVHLSSIFKWFGGDFVRNYGTTDKFAGKSDAERAVLNFLSRYVSDSDRDFLLAGKYEIEYLDYDWSLNEQPSR